MTSICTSERSSIIMMIFRPAGLLPSKRRRRREFAMAEGGEEMHTDEVLSGEQP